MSAPALGVEYRVRFHGPHPPTAHQYTALLRPAPFTVKHISVRSPVAAERARRKPGYYRKVVAPPRTHRRPEN